MVKTKKRIDHANDIIWNLTPTHRGVSGTCKFIKWETTCGRYLVAHITSMFETAAKPKYGIVRIRKIDGRRLEEFIDYERTTDGRASGNYPRYYHNLTDALQAVEDYHTRKYGEVCQSNKMQLILTVDKNQIAPLTHTTKSERKTSDVGESCEARVKQALMGGAKSVIQIESAVSIPGSIRLCLLRMLAKGEIRREGKLYTL